MLSNEFVEDSSPHFQSFKETNSFLLFLRVSLVMDMFNVKAKQPRSINRCGESRVKVSSVVELHGVDRLRTV